MKCDKCGFELIGRYAVVTVQGICDEIPVVEYNLCEDCEDELYKWVINNIIEYRNDKKIRKGDICDDCMQDFIKWLKNR